MTIAILATGDELVHGDILNTNGQKIAHILCSEGLSLGLQLTCGDKQAEILQCLHFLAQKHDIIIIIGGLGPTTDDITRFAMAEFTGDNLVEHPIALAHVKERMHHKKLNQGNLQQCLFPADATLLPNPHGSALGCYYSWQDKILILLPGPPYECLPMFNEQVLPLLQKTNHSKKQIIKWRIFGLAEGEIAQILEDALAPFACQTGYRWEMPYIEFKIRCLPEFIDPIKQVIEPLLAPHVIAPPEKKASEQLHDLIKMRNEPITIIDEATGGLLQLLLTKPGTHHLLDFSQSKKTKLHFHLNGLNEYWLQQLSGGHTQLSIHYSNQSQEGGETHQIPYLSANVVYHAAEWLSFRLFQLINQLH